MISGGDVGFFVS